MIAGYSWSLAATFFSIFYGVMATSWFPPSQMVIAQSLPGGVFAPLSISLGEFITGIYFAYEGNTLISSDTQTEEIAVFKQTYARESYMTQSVSSVLVLFFLAAICYRSKPKVPPSAAALDMIHNNRSTSMLNDCKNLFFSKNYMILVTVGILQGLTWSFYSGYMSAMVQAD